jgi:lipoyl-dependent peroxiredoxin
MALSTSSSPPRRSSGAPGRRQQPRTALRGGLCGLLPWRAEVRGGQEKVRVPNEATVTATVGIGPRQAGGFGITADLKIALPGLDRAQAEALVQKAHQVCPYSNATRGNVDVGLEVVS